MSESLEECMGRNFVANVPEGAKVSVRHIEAWPTCLYEALSDAELANGKRLQAEANRIAAEESDGPWRASVKERWLQYGTEQGWKMADDPFVGEIGAQSIYSTEAFLRSIGRCHPDRLNLG